MQSAVGLGGKREAFTHVRRFLVWLLFYSFGYGHEIGVAFDSRTQFFFNFVVSD